MSQSKFPVASKKRTRHLSIKEWIRRTSEFAEWRSGLKTKLRRWVRTKGFLKGQTAGAMWSVCTMVTVITHLPGLLLSWLHSLKIQNLGKQHAFGLTKVKLAPGFRGGKKQDLTHFVFQKKKKYFNTFTNSLNSSGWFVTMLFKWKLSIAQWGVDYCTVLRIQPRLVFSINKPSEMANTLKKCFNWIFC